MVNEVRWFNLLVEHTLKLKEYGECRCLAPRVPLSSITKIFCKVYNMPYIRALKNETP